MVSFSQNQTTAVLLIFQNVVIAWNVSYMRFFFQMFKLTSLPLGGWLILIANWFMSVVSVCAWNKLYSNNWKEFLSCYILIKFIWNTVVFRRLFTTPHMVTMVTDVISWRACHSTTRPGRQKYTKLYCFQVAWAATPMGVWVFASTRVNSGDVGYSILGPVYTKRHYQRRVNATMTLEILVSLKTMETNEVTPE